MKLKLPLLAAAMMALSAPSQAALFNFTGTITNHNDVIQVAFSIANDATDVRVWTDSFMDGLNFDPITALWHADGTLIDQNDDEGSINPGTQTNYDSGFSLPFLAAGDYIFTIATYNNWAVGALLSDGFIFDNQAPVLIADWYQPANGTGKGSAWSVWLDGVDTAAPPNPDPDPNPSNPVPEPSVLALLAVGALGGLAMRRRKAA